MTPFAIGVILQFLDFTTMIRKSAEWGANPANRRAARQEKIQ
jgi:hypothetical protein